MSSPSMPANLPPDQAAFFDAMLQNAFMRLFEKGQLVSFTSHAVAGTEFSVGHSLGAPPAYYIPVGQAGAGSLYDGTTANTSTLMYFRSSAAATVFTVLLVKGDA